MLPKLRLSLLCGLALFAAAMLPARAQTTFNVPSTQYPSIQSAINAAADSGDTILVAAGTYYENLDFLAKTITVTGPVVPSGTTPTAIIDAQFKGPAAFLETGTPFLFDYSILSYFLIKHGGSVATYDPVFTQATGAISIQGSFPTIMNNTIVDSACFGIADDSGSPIIQGNDISGTEGGSCYVNGGAAIYIDGFGTTFDGTAPVAYITGNTIHDNIESGLDEDDSVNSGGGAGISVNGDSVITENVIYGNSSNGSAGGGVDIVAGLNLTLVQNLIYDNNGCGGGGIALPPSGLGPRINALIANNTLVDNSSNPPGKAGCTPSNQIYEAATDPDDDGPEVILVNNIFSSSTTTGAAVDCALPLDGTPSEASQAIFDHNILHNAGGTFFGQNCVDVSAKYGNLTADPKFSGQAAASYSLGSGSPAIDAGNDSSLALFQYLSTDQLADDFTGTAPRVQNGIIDIGAYEFTGTTNLPAPTTIILTTSAYTGHPGTNYVLTATLADGQNTPTGSVTFYLDGTSVGTSPINAGVATLTGFLMPPGVHAIYAFYPGQGSASAAVSVINIVDITLIITRVFFVADPNPSYFGQSILFTINSSSADGTVPAPITLTDIIPNTLLANLTPDSAGVATFSISTLALGPHNIKAEYAGDLTHAEASDTVQVTVNGYPTTTTLDCGKLTTVPIGSTVPLTATVTSIYGTPTGNVDFTQGKTALGQVALTNGMAGFNATAVAGFNSFTATFPQQNGYGYSVASCAVNVESLTLTSSANPSPAYAPITFTANNAATPAPAGTYSLTIGSNAPVAMTVSGGTATYTTPGLAPGTYTVSVTFTPADGSTPLSASLTGGPQVVSPATGDFTLTGPSTLTTRTEGSVSGTLNLTSIQGFQGTVTLACNLPQPLTYGCTLTPTSVPLTVNGSGAVTITLAPKPTQTASIRNDATSRIVLAALFPLTLLSLAGFTRRRGNLRGLFALVVLAVVAASTTACGSDVYYAATQPGSYPVTVTATGTTMGATTPTTHTLNITLTLTP